MVVLAVNEECRRLVLTLTPQPPSPAEPGEGGLSDVAGRRPPSSRSEETGAGGEGASLGMRGVRR